MLWKLEAGTSPQTTHEGPASIPLAIHCYQRLRIILADDNIGRRQANAMAQIFNFLIFLLAGE